ncbi:Ferredoxin-fold anticodon-binding domain-containing protein 1 [Globisporangium polare]
MRADASAARHDDDGSAYIGDLTNLGLVGAKSNGDAHRVLIVGDGNFSFVRAFLRSNEQKIAMGEISVTATSLDTHEELLQMYPNSSVILGELKDGGVRVVHDVNATKLKQYPSLLHGTTAEGAETNSASAPSLFDRVVFNFPHFAEGGSKRNKIHRHRQLLREFFQSAQDVLAHDGLVWVTLCAGQGGTPLDTKPRAWGDTWQIVHCAADAGFIARNVHLCPVEKLAELGYYSVGYKLKEQAFWTPDSLTHVFCREGLPGVKAHFPIEWTRGISFWTHDGFVEDKVTAILRECFPEPIALSLHLTDTYVCPKTSRTSVTYSVHVSCDRTALNKDRVNARTLDAITRIESSGFASSRAT